MLLRQFLFIAVLALFVAVAGAQKQPVETGSVKWYRSLDEAVKLSKQTQKPILILFQEIPGCSTCRNYGQNVLTHPLIVEAIETFFVPLCIHNNKGGADKKALKYFREPSWNNPVVRIVSDDLKDLIPRIAGQYSKAALVHGMVQALQKRPRQAVPLYLELLDKELQARKSGLTTTYFAMYCFWAGEKEIGDMQGVYSTTAGYMDGKEVVKVEYNPLEVSYFALLQAANDVHCGDEVYSNRSSEIRIAKQTLGTRKAHPASGFKPDKTPKYYLNKTPYRYVRMTALQACRANSRLAKGMHCENLFSPGQLQQYRIAKEGKRNRLKVTIGHYF